MLHAAAQDFDLADRLREELRSSGIDPEKARPPGFQASQTPWAPPPQMSHKRSHSDMAASSGMGYGAPYGAGYGYGGGGGGGGGYGGGGYGGGSYGASGASAGPAMDAETERELDAWVNAKRAKDFAAADKIREQLRARGIEPDRARPSGNVRR